MLLRARRVLSQLVAVALLCVPALVIGAPEAPAAETLPPLTNSAPPTIVGTGWSEEALTLELGEWSSEPDYIGTQWLLDDGSSIANCGGVCDTINLSRSLIGHEVFVRIYAEAECCERYIATSNRIRVSGPRPATEPYARGYMEVGSRIVADEGDWVFPVDRYQYQWYRAERGLVELGRLRSYRIKPRDLGKRLLFDVRAIGSEGRQGIARSEYSPIVEAKPRLGFRTEANGSAHVGVVRAYFSYPRWTVGGKAAITVYRQHRPTRRFRVTSAEQTIRFRLGDGRDTLVIAARGRGRTGYVSRQYDIANGQIVGVGPTSQR